ncbi:hypothetical protein [Nocardia sp. NPDC051570]|uniref:hypothetical protein n=1 Tax=Nocardia sp. NPDC051570 TaxID=3364324 RepID=UPI00378F9C38
MFTGITAAAAILVAVAAGTAQASPAGSDPVPVYGTVQADAPLPSSYSVAEGRESTPEPTVTPVLRRQDFDSTADWWNWEFNNAAPCGGWGALIGSAVGLFFVGSILAPIGGVIGLISCGGRDFIDAFSAFYGGQP